MQDSMHSSLWGSQGGCSPVWLLTQPPQPTVWLLQAVQEQKKTCYTPSLYSPAFTSPSCLFSSVSCFFHLWYLLFYFLSKLLSFLILPAVNLPSPLPSCFLSSPPLIHIQSLQLAPLLEPTRDVRQMLWINRELRLSRSPQLAPSSRVPAPHQESSSPDQSGK